MLLHVQFSDWSCSYKNGALLATFQPGVIDPGICSYMRVFTVSHGFRLSRIWTQFWSVTLEWICSCLSTKYLHTWTTVWVKPNLCRTDSNVPSHKYWLQITDVWLHCLLIPAHILSYCHQPTGENLYVFMFLFAQSKMLFIKHTWLFIWFVYFPANTYTSEYIFSHDKRACHVRFVLAQSLTVINTLADKLLFILLENTDNNATT